MKIEEIKEKLSENLSQEKQVIFAFLYGSYAKNTALKDSDLDLAIYFQKDCPETEIDRIWDELQKISKKDVELLILNNAKEPVAWQAIRGIPLVIKDWGFYLKYMLSVSFEALNFQDDLEDIWLMKKELGYV
jgi:predicted nucleotidyltransferase